MLEGDLIIAVSGDLVLDEPDAGYWLSGIENAFKKADLSIAHLEVPHTSSGLEVKGDVPAPGAPPENIAAIGEAGIDLVTMAGNHIADCGAQGIAETIAALEHQGIKYCGAGSDLNQARSPAILQSGDVSIGVLSYNCVGPEFSWASADNAGCAFLPVATRSGGPVTPQEELTEIGAEALEILAEDIAALRKSADFVIVALHKGITHRPAELAPYERPIAHAAIEAGADAVIAHHAHIVRGIEFHQNRPVFHGLGNGCVVTRALSPDQDHPERAAWAKKRKELFGFEPDPDYYLAPFHPEAVNAFIGQLRFGSDGNVQAGITPVNVEAPGRPVLAVGQGARDICDYLEKITEEAGLPAINIDQNGWVEARA